MTDQQKLIIFQMQKKYYKLRIKRELSKKNPNQSRLDQLRKEKNKVQDKIYYLQNKDIQILSSKINYLKDKDKYLQYQKDYRNKNLDKVREYQREWRNKNKEYLKEYYKNKSKGVNNG